jgi:hypothetical protein
MDTRKAWRDNGLTIVMFSLFLLFWGGQSIAGWLQHNEELDEHGRGHIPWSKYVTSGEFLESTGENWESEFFQMGAFVVLSSFLFQRGSAESNDPDEGDEANPRSAASPRSPAPVHRGGLALTFYSHSLSIALFALFVLSFALHAVGGHLAHNDEVALHHQPPISFWKFLGSSRFWFQSFQNWQSEFLSIAVLIVLSIFLRARGSAQSKPVEAPNAKTGP